jgi:hypothetical protein
MLWNNCIKNKDCNCAVLLNRETKYTIYDLAHEKILYYGQDIKQIILVFEIIFCPTGLQYFKWIHFGKSANC